MFNFDIGDIDPDLNTVLSNINVDLSELQRDILTQVLTDRIRAFSDTLPNKPARVPSIPDRGYKRPKAKKSENP